MPFPKPEGFEKWRPEEKARYVEQRILDLADERLAAAPEPGARGKKKLKPAELEAIKAEQRQEAVRSVADEFLKGEAFEWEPNTDQTGRLRAVVRPSALPERASGRRSNSTRAGHADVGDRGGGTKARPGQPSTTERRPVGVRKVPEAPRAMPADTGKPTQKAPATKRAIAAKERGRTTTAKRGQTTAKKAAKRRR